MPHPQLGVSSGNGPAEAGIALAAAHGATWVELACQHPANRPHRFDAERSAALAERLAELGIRGIVHTDSAINTAEANPAVQTGVLRHFEEYLDLAGRLGSDRMIVHAGLTFSADPRADLDASVAMLRLWAERAEQAGVLLVLENMNVLPLEAEIRFLGCTGAEVAELLDRVDSPALRACADLGHAHLLPGGIPRFLDEVAGRVAHVQLTDNDGVLDHHLALGEGTLDLDVALSALRAQGYDQAVAIELDDEQARITSLPVLRRALDQAGSSTP